MQLPGRPAAATAAGPATAASVDPIKLLKKHKWVFLASIAAGVVVGTIAHYVMLSIYPIYSSGLVYECFTQETEMKPGTNPYNKDDLDRFMSTQVQVLLSDRIVDKTVSDPNLEREAPKWSRQFKSHGLVDTTKAAKALKRNLSASVAGQSNFVRVSFWWNDPDEAAAVMRLLGRTYERDRKLVGNAAIAERKQLIAQAITETADSISRRQRERDRIIQESGADSLNEALTSQKTTMEKTYTELVKVRNDREALTVMRDQLEDELKRASGPKIPDDIRDQVEKEPVIINLKQEVNLLSSELSAMRNRFKDDYPPMRQLATRLDGRKAQLDSERDRLNRQQFDGRLDRYRTNVQSMAAQEDALLKKYEEAQAKSVDLTHILAQIDDISKDINNLTTSRNKMVEDLKTLEVITSLSQGSTRVMLFQDAQSPKSVSFPRLIIMLPLGVALFLGLTAGVVLLMEVVDQRVKTPADITKIPRTRLVGFVPHAAEDPANPAKVETVFRDQPNGVLAESYRQLRGAVLKRMQAAGHKSLVCMSGMPGSGATTIVVNLAHSLAAAEQRVLLIDANFRRPAIHRVLGLQEAPGLAEIIAGSKTLDDVAQKSGYDNLTVVGAGASDARQYERLTSSAMGTLLKEAAGKYDIILLDVAPAMVAGDAVGLANKCDASMLIVRAMGEKRGMVARLRNELSETRAEFLGVVVNAVRAAAGGYLKGNILASHTYQNGGNGKS
jgi:capsular exopolysaccharide synthesis family protein